MVIHVLTVSLVHSLFIQTGFPLIELEEVENASQPDSLQFRAKQSRFMHEDGPDANSAALWPVPAIDFLLGGQFLVELELEKAKEAAKDEQESAATQPSK